MWRSFLQWVQIVIFNINFDLRKYVVWRRDGVRISGVCCFDHYVFKCVLFHLARQVWSHLNSFHLFIGDYHGIIVPVVCTTWVESGTRRIMGWLGCKNWSYYPHTGRLYPQHSSGTCSSETRGAATHCHHEHADKYIAKFIFIEFTVAKPTTIDATMVIGHPSSYSRGTGPSSDAMSAWHGRWIQI